MFVVGAHLHTQLLVRRYREQQLINFLGAIMKLQDAIKKRCALMYCKMLTNTDKLPCPGARPGAWAGAPSLGVVLMTQAPARALKYSFQNLRTKKLQTVDCHNPAPLFCSTPLHPLT